MAFNEKRFGDGARVDSDTRNDGSVSTRRKRFDQKFSITKEDAQREDLGLRKGLGLFGAPHDDEPIKEGSDDPVGQSLARRDARTKARNYRG